MKLLMVRNELQRIQQSIDSGKIILQNLSDDDVNALNKMLSDVVVLLGEATDVRHRGNHAYAPIVDRTMQAMREWHKNISSGLSVSDPDGVKFFEDNKSGPISWKEMRRAVKTLEGIQQSTGLDLEKAINWLDEYLSENISCLWMFPAEDLDDLRNKYKGKKIDIEKLEDHVAEPFFFAKDSIPFLVRLDYGVLSFFMLWNNTCERDTLPTPPPFFIYGDFVKIRVSKDGTILGFRLFECGTIPEDLYTNDELTQFLEDSLINQASEIKIGETGRCNTHQEHCQRLDALLSKIVKPVITDEVVWRHGAEELPKNVSVRARTAQDDEISFYCFRNDFDFICKNVPNCCGECSMLRWVYEELLPKALDKDSLSRLRKTVTDVCLFSQVDNDDLYICYKDCNKKNCQRNVRIAIDEIYRHYFDVITEMRRASQ